MPVGMGGLCAHPDGPDEPVIKPKRSLFVGTPGACSLSNNAAVIVDAVALGQAAATMVNLPDLRAGKEDHT